MSPHVEWTILVALVLGIGGGIALRAIPWRRISGNRKVSPIDDYVSGAPGRCGQCGAAVIEEDSRFCPRCGSQLQVTSVANQQD